jgi:hypothetical protein
VGEIGRMGSDLRVWGTQCRSAGFCSGLTVWISVIGEPTEGKALRSVDI